MEEIERKPVQASGVLLGRQARAGESIPGTGGVEETGTRGPGGAYPGCGIRILHKGLSAHCGSGKNSFEVKLFRASSHLMASDGSRKPARPDGRLS